MKLATLKSFSRDGELAVASRDLTRLRRVQEIAPTMQAAIENWSVAEKPLEAVFAELNRGEGASEPLDPTNLMSPMPRAYLFWDCSAYLRHIELMFRWTNSTPPSGIFAEPMGYQGGSDITCGPVDDIRLPPEAEVWGIDFEAELAVITDHVPMMTTEATASRHIRLVMLLNDVSLRNLIPHELNKGFGLFQSKTANTFAPLAVTPDELGEAWDGDKLHLPLISTLNGEPFGRPNAGEGSLFGFRSLIAFLSRTRDLGPGSIIGGGTVSNLDRSVGSSCIAERRMLDAAAHIDPPTAWMRFGDRIRVEMLDTRGESIFGAIDQRVSARPRND